MRYNFALLALETSTNLVAVAPAPGEDGVAELVARVTWDDKTMEAA